MILELREPEAVPEAESEPVRPESIRVLGAMVSLVATKNEHQEGHGAMTRSDPWWATKEDRTMAKVPRSAMVPFVFLFRL